VKTPNCNRVGESTSPAVRGLGATSDFSPAECLGSTSGARVASSKSSSQKSRWRFHTASVESGLHPRPVGRSATGSISVRQLQAQLTGELVE